GVRRTAVRAEKNGPRLCGMGGTAATAGTWQPGRRSGYCAPFPTQRTAMSLGRATLPKMLAFAGIGLVAGAWLAFSGSGQQWFGPLSVLFLAAFGGYVGWLLLVKNKTLRKATPAQIAEAQRFLPVAERGVVYL